MNERNIPGPGRQHLSTEVIGPGGPPYGLPAANGLGVPGAGGLGHPGGFGSNAAGQNDLVGAVMRRKFVVILLGLIGTALGYLYFVKTPPSYKSETRLQITTQAPPKFVDGDMVLQKTTSAKHTNLITSFVVLSKAVEDGKLMSTKTMAESESGVGYLKNNLTAASLRDSDEVVVLSLTGPYPDELPTILTAVVSAYDSIMAEDNRAVGEESIELIEKLQERMIGEKNDAERRYSELIRKIGEDATSENGELVNPYAPQLAALTQSEIELAGQLRETETRLQAAASAIGEGTEEQRMLVVLDARKQLELNLRAEEPIVRKEQQQRIDIAESIAQIKQIDAQLISAGQAVEETQNARKVESLRRGAGHPTVRVLDERIEQGWDKITKLQQRRETLVAEIKQSQAAVDGESLEVDWKQVQAEYDAQLVRLYLTSLERERQRIAPMLDSVRAELESVRKNSARVAGDLAELKLLDRQIAEKREAVRVILDQLSELNVVSNNYSMTKIRVTDPAGNGWQVDPNLPKSLAVGTLIGMLLGTGLAWLIDRADLIYRNPHEITQRLGAVVMGRIPRARVKGKGSNLITAHQANSAFTEAFRTTRTSLLFASNEQGLKTILCTSPSPGDGKSTTVSNLALSLAQAGKKVLLVDVDFRRPRIHSYLGMEIGPGILDVLEGNCNIEEAIRPTVESNLFVLTTGGRPKNPGELIAGEPFHKMLEKLRVGYDFVFIDSPPILPVADPCVIASQVDGVLMVLRIRKGVRMTSEKAKESLQRVGARIIGVVVNGIDENPHYNEYGYYGYQYGYNGYGYKYQEKKYADYAEKLPAKAE